MADRKEGIELDAYWNLIVLQSYAERVGSTSMSTPKRTTWAHGQVKLFFSSVLVQVEHAKDPTWFLKRYPGQ